MSESLLTINTGSSSLKSALYDRRQLSTPLASVQVTRIGSEGPRLRVFAGSGPPALDEEVRVTDLASALRLWLEWLRTNGLGKDVAAAGHRLVHGGTVYTRPQRLNSEVLRKLEELSHLDPEHMPAALSTVRAASDALPDKPQIACFDTAFHRGMPWVAQQYALPRRCSEAGVIRFGFHGLSCEYVMEELGALDPAAARGRVIIAHLGSGASMTAVREGVSADTTMGYTPAGGLVMSSRSGDLDPGVLVQVLRSGTLSPDEASRLVNSEAGLLGVSGTTGDMARLLELEPSDQRAGQAVALFCYQAKKFLGALATVLGGLETLVFTGGIGENSPLIRRRICEGLQFLGIELQPRSNEENAAIVSGPGSQVCVRVIRTNEELMIARHVDRLLQSGEAHAGV